MKYFLVVVFLFPVLVFGQKIIPQTGHSGRFKSDISFDDKLLITGGTDGKFIIWDLDKCLAIHYGFSPSPINACGFNGDATKFFICYDSTLVLYNIATLKETGRLKTESYIVAAKYNPKYALVAVAMQNGTIAYEDMNEMKEWGADKTGKTIYDLAYSSNGAILFAAGNSLIGYSVADGKEMINIPIKDNKYCSSVYLSEKDQYLYLSISDGTTEIVSLSEIKNLGSLPPCNSNDENGRNVFVRPIPFNDNDHILGLQDGNFVITNLTKMESNLYNLHLNTPILSILSSHQSDFFIIESHQSNLIKVNFNGKQFLSGNNLYWKRLQYSTDRIYKLDFDKNDESIALQGKYNYHFNLKYGDLYKRDDDSLKLSSGTYDTRAFTIPGSKNYFLPDYINRVVFEIDGQTNKTTNYYAFANSEDTNTFAMFDGYSLLIYNLKTKNKTVQEFPETNLANFLVPYTLYNEFVMVHGDQISVYNSKGEKVLNQKNIFESGTEQLVYDEGKTKMMVIDKNKSIYQINLKTGKKDKTPASLSGSGYINFDISWDGTTLFTLQNNNLKLVDLKNDKLISEKKYDYETPLVLALSHKKDIQAVGDVNGIVHLYNLNDKKELVHIIVSPSNGMVVYDNENHYIATKEAANNLAMVKNNQVVSFESMDAYYNQPHAVLKSIGKADENIIKVHEYVYQKRLKKAGINTQSNTANAPTLTLNQHQLNGKSPNEKAKINISAADANTSLSYLIVYQNGVESERIVLGNKKEITLDVDVTLFPGINHIELAAYNTAGVHSEKMEVSIVSSNQKLPDLYLVTIGVSEFNDSKFNLTYAAKDAKDIQAAFKENKSCYNKIYDFTLTNEQVTKANLQKTFNELKKANKDDIVIITYSSHGVLNSSFDYFLATTDMDFNAPEKNGLAYTDLEKWMSELKPIRKVLMLDACHSGEVDKDDVQLMASTTSTKTNVKFRNVGATVTSKKSFGLATTYQLSNELFTDLRENSGTAVISSSSGIELSMESEDWKNGLFTYCLLNGLKNKKADSNSDNYVTYTELKDYIEKEVVQLSGGKQQPTARVDIRHFNFRIW